jgi:hypothetical protein
VKTEDLIRLMAEDGAPTPRLSKRVARALALGAGFSALLLLATVGLRAGILDALLEWRVQVKILASAALAAASIRLVFAAGIPGERPGRHAAWLALPLLLIAAAMGAELHASAHADWGRLLIGRYSALCLFFIPLLSLAPLAALLTALSHGAPEHPASAGAAAGLAAGTLAAALYAWHCPDDSPLFLTWYLTAIALATLTGAGLGRVMLRW